MTMSPRLRKIALTTHVMSSIGWFGAVVAFLVLAFAGLPREDLLLMRAAYLGMALTGWIAILPLALVSLISGVISSLGTKWGLIRHYWVLAKLMVTPLITLLLLVHLRPVDLLANVAATSEAFSPHLSGMRIQMVAYAIATLSVLILLGGLSVYKPAGLTRYGWRKQQEARPP